MRLSQMLLARSRWLASAVARELGGSLASNYREQGRASEGEPRPIFIASERGRASEPQNLPGRARPSERAPKFTRASEAEPASPKIYASERGRATEPQILRERARPSQRARKFTRASERAARPRSLALARGSASPGFSTLERTSLNKRVEDA